MPHRLSTLALLCSLLLPLGPRAHAQTLSNGLLEGLVQDTLGRPVGGARVVVRDATTGFSHTTTTPASGRFEVAFLPPGEYSLLVEHFSFRPKQVLAVPIHASGILRLRIPLAWTRPPAEWVDTVVFRGALLAGRGGGMEVLLPRAPLVGFPQAGWELAEVGRFSSAGEVDGSTQGLPASLGGVRIDGVPASTAGRSSGWKGLSTAAFPLDAFGQVSLVASSPDVEWSGVSGGAVHGHSRRGSRELRVQAFGSSDYLASRTGAALGAYSRPVQGGVVVSGPLIRDTAAFVVGVESWRSVSPFDQAGAASAEGGGVVEIARDSFGVALEGGTARVAEVQVVSAFGNLDWNLGPKSLLSVRSHFAAASLEGASRPGGPAPGWGGGAEERDGWASVSLASRLGPRVAQEVRVAMESSRRTTRDLASPVLPASTWLAGEGLGIGPEAGMPASAEETAVRASETLSLRAGAHRVKVGLAAAWRSFDYAFDPYSEFYFSGREHFARGYGYFVQTAGTAFDTRVTLPQVALFAQDTWTPVPGLEVLLGLRYDAERIPRDRFDTHEEWMRLSGLADGEVRSTWDLLQPRFGLTWDIQDRHEWVLSASAGVYAGSVDAPLLSELAAGGRRGAVRRGLGSLGRWPASPGAAQAPEVGPMLSLAAPSLGAPRTTRATLGLSRLLGGGTALHLNALYRYTDLLPRRANLNLRTAPVARNQFGQPVYGDLVQQGGLLVPATGSNRRFDGFDRVYAFNSDGWSRHAALTARLEHRAGERVQLFGSYTFSRTTDNWPAPGSGAPDAQLPPLPSDPDWLEGRSDYDVPHRLVAGAEVRPLSPLRLAVLYRYRSGDPFTPGYRAGVDVNGDGSVHNDPAYVDAAVPGVSGLAARWTCLRKDGLPERNACRTGAVYSLDLRVAWEAIRTGRYAASLTLDGLNLLASGAVAPDRALYLLDESAGPLRAEEGTVHLPLLANEDFGNPVVRFGTARTLRLGLRVRY